MNFEQLANYVLTFVMVALAVYRLSVMLSQEHGPWHIFSWLRGDERMVNGMLVRKKGWHELLSCPFCLSVYFALAGTPFLPYYGIGWFVVSWWAISGVSVLLTKKYG